MTNRIRPMNFVIAAVSPVRLPQFFRNNHQKRLAQACCSALFLLESTASEQPRHDETIHQAFC